MEKYFLLMCFSCVVIIVLTNTSAGQIDQQNFQNTVPGEITLDVDQKIFESILVKVRFSLLRTEKQITIYAFNLENSQNNKSLGEVIFNFVAPAETKIISASFKSDEPGKILVLLSDKRVLVFVIDHEIIGGEEVHWVVDIQTHSPLDFLSSPLKILGDAMYILANGSVYASWDTAKTWASDSINISSQSVNGITVDTNFFAWIITQSRNLYYQHPDSNIWHKDTSFKTTGFPRAIFIDRKGRMFISTTASSGRVLLSTDGGASFTNTSSGITGTIISFGDDAFGNIYALSTGSDAYRLSNLTLPWESIGDSLKAVAYLPSNTKIINSLKGDSILYAATIYGTFQSTDFGTTWEHSPDPSQSRSHNFYTSVIRAGNYNLISNNLGIFRNTAGDSTWKKIFPQRGFVWGVNAVAADSAGNIYGNLPMKTGATSWLFYIMKSTDGGTTWMYDTAGQKALGLTSGTQQYNLFVDQQGTLYLGGNGVLYSKKPEQHWIVDTTGLGIKSDEFIADLSLNNKKGITYLARRVGAFPTYSLAIYQRSSNDSIWHRVNTSLLATTEGRIISDHEGNIIVRTLSGSYKFWKYNAEQWSEIPQPTGLGSNSFAQVLAVDQSGVLWGVFFGNGINQGVYYTSDNGVKWNYAGLKGVGIKYLSTVNDTAYAVTIIDGVFGFTATLTPALVNGGQPQLALAFQLFQNYPNPFNPTTTIHYHLPVKTFVTITVYDLLGREVATLVNEELRGGFYSVPFNASALSSGVYFYRMQAGYYTQTKKFILQK
ncbi:MAG: T9SS type A sorting domain-containing protein [Bacteriovoracaceae bacterium]